MSIKKLNFTVTGFAPLLLNNPQTADPLNHYSKLIKPITSKASRKTDDDWAELHDLEIRSKIYWDDEIGIYIPGTWIIASIGGVSNSVAKIGKAKIRGGVFMNESKIKLNYKGISKVSDPLDIVKNSDFRHKMILPQGQVRLPKVFPIFHEWSFESSLEFDESVTTSRDLQLMMERAAHYAGYGDFRPTFGRATVESDEQ